MFEIEKPKSKLEVAPINNGKEDFHVDWELRHSTRTVVLAIKTPWSEERYNRLIAGEAAMDALGRSGADVLALKLMIDLLSNAQVIDYGLAPPSNPDAEQIKRIRPV